MSFNVNSKSVFFNISLSPRKVKLKVCKRLWKVWKETFKACLFLTLSSFFDIINQATREINKTSQQEKKEENVFGRKGKWERGKGGKRKEEMLFNKHWIDDDE